MLAVVLCDHGQFVCCIFLFSVYLVLFLLICIGSIIVFDDYGFALTGGARKFVDELEDNPDFVTVRNLNGHAVVIRRSAT